MIKKYNILFKGTKRGIDDLENAIKEMKYNKVMFMQSLEFRRLKGRRNNWFPLLLLDRYTITHVRNQLENRIAVYNLLSNLIEDETKRSFYIEGYRRENNAMLISYRSKENYDNIIQQILYFFN